MKGYKLTNNDGSVYAIYSCKDYANATASQHLMQRGAILKMEEIEMPIFEPLCYEFMDAGGDETDYESPSKKQLEHDVEVNFEGEKSWTSGHTIAFGYDVGGNECYLIEEAA